MIIIKVTEILALTPSIENIAITTEFITSQTMSLTTYQSVFIHLLTMKFKLSFLKESLEEGIAHYQKFKNNDLDFDPVLTIIIQVALTLEQFELADQYIKIRSQQLPILNKYLATYDVIQFKKITNQPYQTDLENIITDVIPTLDKISFSLELLKMYYQEKNYSKALVLIDSMGYYDNSRSYVPYQLKINLEIDNLVVAEELAHTYLNDYKYDLDAFITLLQIYEIKQQTHQAIILETKFEHRFEELSDEKQLLVYQTLAKIYELEKNKLSLEHYQEKLNLVSKRIAKLEKPTSKKSKTKTSSNQSVIINSIYQTETKLKSNVIAQFEWIFDLMQYSHQINDTKQLREYLRSFFIYCDKLIKIKDYILYLTDSSVLYNYKVERLYDKVVTKESLVNTLIEKVLKTKTELILATNDLDEFINPLTKQKYQNVSYVYAIPVNQYGVMLFHLEEVISDPADYYEVLKAITIIIENHLVDLAQIQRLKSENFLLNKIMDAPLFNFRILENNFSTYNIEAQKLFNIEAHLPLELFIKKLHQDDVHRYQSSIGNLINKANQSAEISYNYEGQLISEKLYSIRDGDSLKVLSLFIDITNSEAEKVQLLTNSKIDLSTKLFNLNALNLDFPNYLTEKGSFLLIELMSIAHLHGYETNLLYFKEFIQVIRQHFKDAKIYRFNEQTIFVYLNYNDIRTITKAVESFLSLMSDYEPETINFERFKSYFSIIRYPVVTSEKALTKILRYLELTLDKLKKMNPNLNDAYMFFEYKLYEEEQFEQTVINYLNQAIQNQNLEITFSQIIDLSSNMVWYYESRLSLPNLAIDDKYLIGIAKKRNRIIDLELYHLKLVCQFLNCLEQETKRLVKIIIPISKETFLSFEFKNRLIEILQKYQIPTNFIRLQVVMTELKAFETLDLVNELIALGILVDVTLVEAALTDSFTGLILNIKKELTTKWLSYYQSLQQILETHGATFILKGVMTKDQKEKLANTGIKYIEGSIYKKINPNKLIDKIKEDL